MTSSEHPLRNPQVCRAIEDLHACHSRIEWDMALGRLVATLVMAGWRDHWIAQVEPKATQGTTGPESGTAFLIDLQCRIEAGPPRVASNRPRANLEAILDTRRLDAYRAAGANIRSKADAAKFLREMLGLKMSYQAAIKRAGRAIERGGFTVPGLGKRFGRLGVPK